MMIQSQWKAALEEYLYLFRRRIIRKE